MIWCEAIGLFGGGMWDDLEPREEIWAGVEISLLPNCSFSTGPTGVRMGKDWIEVGSGESSNPASPRTPEGHIGGRTRIGLMYSLRGSGPKIIGKSGGLSREQRYISCSLVPLQSSPVSWESNFGFSVDIELEAEYITDALRNVLQKPKIGRIDRK